MAGGKHSRQPAGGFFARQSARGQADPAPKAQTEPSGANTPPEAQAAPAGTNAPHEAGAAPIDAGTPPQDVPPGMEGLRSAFADSEQQRTAGDGSPVWDLSAADRPGLRALGIAARIGLVALFVCAVCVFWPMRPGSGDAVTIAPATPRPRPTATPRAASGPESGPGTEPTATPTATRDWDAYIEQLTAEQKKLLDDATKVDDRETTYDSAEDYFGSDDVLLDFYDILEDVPAPTPEPTPEPTPTSEPTPTPEPGTTPDPNATAPPTAEPTAPPTAAPAPADGPVLQGSGSAACVKTYNAWDDALKRYTWETARAYGVSYEMVLAIIYHESRFQADATHVNSNGTTDWGLMQINDVCFDLLHSQLGINSMEELLDPHKGVQAGCAILAYHLKYTGNEEDALLRYQVGAGNYKYYKDNGTVPLCYTNTLALRDEYIAAGI